MVEHVFHGVEVGYGGGDGIGLAKSIDRLGHKEVDKSTSVLTNEVSEGKLGLSKEDKLCRGRGEREREREREREEGKGERDEGQRESGQH